MDLKATYLTTLAHCAPDVLVRAHVTPDMPRNVIAIGKCAGALLDGVAAVHPIESAFVAVPEGYPLPAAVPWPEHRESAPHPPSAPSPHRDEAAVGRGGKSRQIACLDPFSPPQRGEGARRADEGSPSRHWLTLAIGGHPHYTRASFEAGRALLDFVETHDDILFLVSGGGSACVEVPLIGEEEARQKNAELIASGKPIAEINAVRRSISAIKGGKLAAKVRGRAVTLVYSDVSKNALHDVASGPTIPGSEAVLIADNTTLVKAAAQIIGDNAVVLEEQIECDVLDAATMLAARARELRKGQVLVAGGEPTVVVRGSGRGGRCSELAVRFAGLCEYEALFASSDGVDGNSGAAGIYLPRGLKPRPHWRESDSFPVAAQIGEPIMIAPTGNNLRDLFFVACV